MLQICHFRENKLKQLLSINPLTCIDNKFGCLLLKWDTGLSLEVRNSQMICKIQFKCVKTIHFRLCYTIKKRESWWKRRTSVNGKCWLASVFLHLNLNTSKKKDPQEHCIGYRCILSMMMFCSTNSPKSKNIRLVRELKIFLKGPYDLLIIGFWKHNEITINYFNSNKMQFIPHNN